MKRKLLRMVALIMMFSVIFTNGVMASNVEDMDVRASDYLDSYNAYCYAAGQNGKIEIYFSVTADTYLADVGVTSIRLYESSDNGETWTLVQTFRSSSFPSMMGHNVIQHNSHISYYGVPGRYYKANISIWAGSGGNTGDSRYYTTGQVQAIR